MLAAIYMGTAPALSGDIRGAGDVSQAMRMNELVSCVVIPCKPVNQMEAYMGVYQMARSLIGVGTSMAA